MKNTTSEPPGRPSVKKLNSSFPKRSSIIRISGIHSAAKAALEVVTPHAYASVEALVDDMRPEIPVYCLRPEIVQATARKFIKTFPGQVLYAVKTNPQPRVLRLLAEAGVTHFDVASLAEIRQVVEQVPDAKLFFMHPVKSRQAIRSAYYEYGVRDFSLDSLEELEKIVEMTNGAQDLNLFVRLAISNDSAAYSLSGKFGVTADQSEALLLAVRGRAQKMGICFHVGSQCMRPEAYTMAMQQVADLLTRYDLRIDVLDIGGGFPSVYPGMVPPPLADYMKAIKKGLKAHPSFATITLLGEPGRALVAEAGSTLARVELRKGNMLYLNEGIFGSFFDAGGSVGFNFPVKAIRSGGVLSQRVAEFGFFGPTCDSMDVMQGPFYLPEDIAEGDWIEVGQLGAYGMTMRTDFNGFRSDVMVEVSDKPILSLLEVH